VTESNNLSLRPFATIGAEGMPAKLVSKDDPEKKGRIKVRMIHQLESLIPDDKLPWTQPEGQTTAGAGDFKLGDYIIGQWFHVMTRDDGQTISIDKTLTSPGKSNTNNNSWTTHFPTKSQENKFLKKIMAGTGDIKNDQKVQLEEGDKSHHDQGRDVNNGKAEHADKKPIGQREFDKGNEILDFIKKVDPSNSSGAVQPAVDIMKKLLNNTNPLNAIQGMMGGDLYNIMNQVMALINKAGGGGGGSNGGIQPQMPCSLIDPKTKLPVLGTLQYDRNAVITCIPNNPDGTPGHPPGVGV